MAAFAAVRHLVTRFNANQQARARKLYAQGLIDQNTGDLNAAVEDFRTALTGDRSNSQYQLSLGRALRDTGRLDEAMSYLQDLWQRTPQDGTINLALARVAARRGSMEDAFRYYHNAMYGVWNSDPEGNRRKARLELIDFLLQKNAHVEAQPELMALATSLPADPKLHLQVASLFEQDDDYRDALSEYEKVLRADRGNLRASAGAGRAAFHLGKYRTAERYLRIAANGSSQDSGSRAMLDIASLILITDPFVRRISDAERNRRIRDAWAKAGERLTACIQMNAQGTQTPVPASAANPDSQNPANSPPVPNSLTDLQTRWGQMKADLPRLKSSAENDLPDAIMDLVFQIEQQTATECGQPHGEHQALLLISRDRDAADQ